MRKQPKVLFDNTNPLVVKGPSSGSMQYLVTGIKLPALNGAAIVRRTDATGPGINITYRPPSASKVWVILAQYSSYTAKPYLTDGVNLTNRFGSLNNGVMGFALVSTYNLYWGFADAQGIAGNRYVDILEIDLTAFPTTVGQFASVAVSAEYKMQPPAGETWRINPAPIDANQLYARGYEAGALAYNGTANLMDWFPDRAYHADNQSYPAVFNDSAAAAWYGYTGFKLP